MLPDQALVDHEDRQRLGPHGLHQLRRAAGRRDGLRRTVRRVPLGLRQSLLGETIRRSRASATTRLMAQLWGTMALRLANAEVLPFDFDAYAGALRDFVRRLDDIPGARRQIWTSSASSARTRALRARGRRLNQRVESALAAGPLGARRRRPREPEAPRHFEQGWAARRGHPRPSVVQAPAVRAALHLRRDDAARGSPRRPRHGDWTRAAPAARAGVEGHREEHGARSRAPRPTCRRRRPADSLESRLRAIRDGVDGRMAIYVENVATGERVAIDADPSYETFSVIKVPIMATVLRAGAGRPAVARRSHHAAPRPAAHPVGRALRARSRAARRRCRTCSTLMTSSATTRPPTRSADLVGRDAVTAFMAPPRPAEHDAALLGSRLGSALAVRARSRLRDAQRRPDGAVPVREVRRRRGGRGVPAASSRTPDSSSAGARRARPAGCSR